ncbi:hypothetical protein PBI_HANSHOTFIRST_16 [Mycobacterium phage HanShotFirst]|uniref:head-tail connector protein n=1 Tax=Mycobacterium phage HanShotFirst TaxID=1429904 RepID=UPI0003C975AD|nr:head-tail connector protein [Mycobacterium phage HanShotFirst]AHB31793.1 hypothetical protein PBI_HANSHOTFIRST_16 [Mycobacterium phage HanShotFirst]
MTAPFNGAVVRGWLGSLSDAEIIAKLADLETEDPDPVEVSWDDVTDKPTTFPPVIGTGAADAKAGNYAPTWAEVTGKPSTFAPAAHTHEAADVTDLGDSALLNVGTAAGTVAAGNHTHSNYVPTTRTVNTKALSANVVLNGADVALTGYEIGTEPEAAVAAADTVNEAIAKLEKRIADLEASA